ncbi:bifunctional uridylate/adenylate kinase [Massospora cicadina]|nr:bifunctional uridylate/adenylate kinase [Massospora cicadina]
MTDKTAPVVIFVLGGPGAGKGTQCANLVKDFNFLHLSAGDLLRAEMARAGSEFGELISTYIKEGKIVPKEVTLKLIQEAMARSPGSMVLLDGFPRKMDQALEFEHAVAPCKAVLYFTCTEEAMLERLLKRGETSGRSDDNEESIVKRFQTFKETSLPVIQHYQAEGKVIEIDTLDTPDNVYLATKAQIQKLLGLDAQGLELELPAKGTTEEPLTKGGQGSPGSDSLLPEFQVGSNSSLSEVLEHLSIGPQTEPKETSSAPETVPEQKVAEIEEPKLNEATDQQSETKVEACQPTEVPAFKDENRISNDVAPEGVASAPKPSAEAPHQAFPQQPSIGPSSPKGKHHTKKKSSCLVM